MRCITLGQALELHRRIIEQSGGARGILSVGALESALLQPSMSFGGEYLYATLAEKAAALAFSIIQNHPFLDGNKRVGHAAMEVFLVLNGYEVLASVVEAEGVILRAASGEMTRPQFAGWVEAHLRPLK